MKPNVRNPLPLWGLCLLFAGLFSLIAPRVEAQDTVYRVIVISDLDERSALDYKAELEGLGFLPIKLDFVNNPVTVLYGEFQTQEAAIRSKDSLRAAGFTPGSVVSMLKDSGGGATTDSATSGAVYRVLVDEVASESEARDVQTRLEEKGFLFAEIEQSGGRYQVITGKYQDPNDARNLVALLKNQGFNNAVLLNPDSTVATPTSGSSRPRQTAQATATPEPQQSLSPVITQSSIWRELNEDQKRKVIDTVMMQDQLRSGDHMAQKIIDLERRVDDLDAKSQAVVKMIQDEREAEAQRNLQITRLYRDAQNLARGRQYDEALVKYRQILQIDPNHQLAATQIRVVEGFLRGERYDGQNEENQAKYIKLKAEAERLKAEGTIDALREAKNRWVMIRAIDPERFEEEADSKLNVISNQLATLEQERQAVEQAEERKNNALFYGAIVFVIGLVLVVATLSIFYVRRQRQQILSELRSITQSSVRPPRQLDGSGTVGHIGSSATAGGYDASDVGGTGLFGDDSMSGQPGDPLGQTAPPPPPPKPKPQPAPQPAQAQAPPRPQPAPQPQPKAPEPEPEPEPVTEESGPVTMALNMGSDTTSEPDTFESPADIDDLFAVDETEQEPVVPEPEKKMPAPAAPQPPKQPQPAGGSDDTSAFDEIFSDLPSLDDTAHKEPVPAASNAKQSAPDDTSEAFSLDDALSGTSSQTQPTQAEDRTQREETGISFDDIMAAETGTGNDNHHAAGDPPAPAREERKPEPAQARKEATDDPFADSPFADILGGPAETGKQNAAPGSSPGAGADQDVPAVANAAPDVDPFSNLGGSETVESPAYAASQPAEEPADAPPQPKLAAGDAPTALPPSSQTGPQTIVVQDFSNDQPGGRPGGWEGEYDYADLKVHSEDPPQGARNYVAYEKKKGAGKVYYSSKFPNTSGVINVEFDLRCNNKNKFLLGFYIEKDEDFQQSVHTKILLSETQTTPTIHIHGEPAPYLLGSWAHIKYVIDLKKGLVNGYIDGTHIARDFRLPQAPKHLNTLAIRDNINTTGELLIGNIKIEKLD